MDDPTTDVTTDEITETTSDVVEELLVEEVSIDGMCGVY
jgi:mycofactocin precursor